MNIVKNEGYIQFQDMSRDEKIALFTHVIDGGAIEWFNTEKESWGVKKGNTFYNTSIYRMALTKPSINWDHVNPSFIAMATDEDGNTYIYTEVPSKRLATAWAIAKGCTVVNACAFVSFAQGTCDWKDSLVLRPTQESNCNGN